MSRRQTRWLRMLLSLTADRETRTDMLASLDDEYAQRRGTEGPRAAARWYRGQVWRSLAPLLARRFKTLSWHGGGRDLRFALRSVRATPGFSLAIVLMLAVGIGAHTVVAAVYDGLMLRPLPYGERSARLVTLHTIHPTFASHWEDSDVSYPDLVDVRAMSGTLDAVEAAVSRSISVTVNRDTQRVLAASITPGLFDMMGIRPAMGRTFIEAEGAAAGFETAAIIGHRLWESLFQSRTDVVGQGLAINGRQITVVGVMPRGFSFPGEHELWLPYRGNTEVGRGNRGFVTFGLIGEGQSLDRVRTDLARVADQLALAEPGTNRGWTLDAIPMRRYFVSDDSDEATLLAAVTLLLVVACANVAGLLVARGLARQRELAVRAALGAGRARLVRQLLLEVGILAAAGGALGLAMAFGGITALVAWIPEPLPYWATPQFDLRLVTFSAVLTATVALVAGGIPALRVAAAAPPTGLLAGARSAADAPAHRRLQRWLVVGQVAVGFALLVGAGLLVRSGQAFMTANGGFDPDGVLSLRVYIAGDRYDAVETRKAVVDDMVRRIAEIPGVEHAAATSAIPTDDGGTDARIATPWRGSDQELGALSMSVTPDFWKALGLSLIDGRVFQGAELTDPAGDAVIVNRTLADRLWPNDAAVGQTFRAHLLPRGEGLFRVVGVAPDLVYEEFSEQTPQSMLNVYVPYVRAGGRVQAFLVRTAHAATVLPLIRDQVRAVDPGFALFDAMTMRDRRSYNHWSDVFIGRTFSTFAGATLLLACIGAYGIAAFNVAHRRREIGVRLAIGASRSNVLSHFLAGGARLAVAGAVAGLPLALLTARALEQDLFRVTPWEVSIWLLPPVTLVAVVVLASYVPARRASRVDPVSVLRTD